MTSDRSRRFSDIFFEVFEALPRQGPGERASAERALSLCRALPPSPLILDLGCGVGAQTLYLAELTTGRIVAVDNHAPSIERLNASIARHRLADRVVALVGDMAHLHQPPESFDLIWSEGALYSIGLENALRVCHGLLRPGGQLVFTDAVWRKDDRPPELASAFAEEYPTMGRVEDVLATLAASGFDVLGHFTLPEAAWWRDFYTPMEARIDALRGKYARDPEALALLEQIAEEPKLHRRYSAYYAYEFFIARRREAPPRRAST
ncbi:methyltransferase domain-containing protein [Ectothiorhodospiraceae bacterium 2226]|nr:methyltransferase domain-containing protein [Ectothiorhodospiraceae bacterium 2226]